MKKETKYKLIKTSIFGVLLATTITGCAKKMDCNIEGEHVHLYINPDNSLSKYIESEREKKWGCYWTSDFKRINEKNELMLNNDLCIVSDNMEYLTNTISKYSPRRFAYVYDCRYVSTYGYRYGYDVSSGKFKYRYVPINEYRWNYDWY